MEYGFDYNYHYEPPKKKKNAGARLLILGIVFIAVSLLILLTSILIMTVNKNFLGAGTRNTEFHVSAREVLLNNGEAAGLADTVEYVEKSIVAIGSTEDCANGSGVIFTPDGFIVTNNHVVSGQTSVYICLHNGNVYKADVWATDEKSDIAVVKIKTEEELIPAVIGDSSKIRSGESIFVIGNPTGVLKGSVTSGIISYENRLYTVEGLVMNLIQIDAAVNGGNSGGGLFNEYGELIGIVNAKITGLTVESLGFAIPSNIVEDIAQQLIEQKYVSGRPYLGLTVETKAQYSYTGISYKYIVTKSEYCTDIKEGDEVVLIGGKSLSEYSASQILYGYSVGDEIEVVVVRDGKTITVKYALREYKPNV